MTELMVNDVQQARDVAGLSGVCAACGHEESPFTPLVIADDGYRVHLSHLVTEGNGYFGAGFRGAS